MSTEFFMLCGAVILLFLSGCLLVHGYYSVKLKELKIKYHFLRKGMIERNAEKAELHLESDVTAFTVLNSSYDSIIKKTGTHPSIIHSVLSDQLGLPVASSSKQCEELATVSILFSECEDRLKWSLGFDKLHKIEFTYNNNDSLTVFPIIVNNQTLYFSGISKGKPDYESLFAEKC